MWEQLKRIIKPNGAIVLFGTEPFSSALRMSNIKMFKYDWVWKKTKPTGFSHSKNMPLKDFELISVFSLGAIGHKKLIKNRMEYNPQGVFDCIRKIKRNKKGFDGTMERDSQTNEYIGELSGFPKMVLEFNNVISNKTTHPTQKPVALMEYLVKTYTNEGETVLDFTM
jgi:site-specific DNA-methyltransferase (adenine-specific)